MSFADQFSIKELQQIRRNLDCFLRRNDEKKTRDPEQIFLDAADLMQLMNLSPHRVKYLRRRGQLRHYRVRGKRFFRLGEVLREVGISIE